MAFLCRCSHRHQSVVPVDIIIEPCETITILSIMIYITMYYIYTVYNYHINHFHHDNIIHNDHHIIHLIHIYTHTHTHTHIYIHIETIDDHIIVKIMVRSWSIDGFRRIWVVKRWWTSPAKRRGLRMGLLLGWFTEIITCINELIHT